VTPTLVRFDPTSGCESDQLRPLVRRRFAPDHLWDDYRQPRRGHVRDPPRGDWDAIYLNRQGIARPMR
jgi:hypothetical protein